MLGEPSATTLLLAAGLATLWTASVTTFVLALAWLAGAVLDRVERNDTSKNR